MSWDVEALIAIDTHVHVEQDGHGCCSLDQELLDTSAKYFEGDANRTPTVDDLAAYYREPRIGAVVFTVDATTAMGCFPANWSGPQTACCGTRCCSGRRSGDHARPLDRELRRARHRARGATARDEGQRGRRARPGTTF